MSHISELEDKDVNAGFLFFKRPPSGLTKQVIKGIMDYAFREQGVPGNPAYVEYIVIAENNGMAPDAQEQFDWVHPSLPGVVYRTDIDALRKVDDKRRDSERNRKPGQESERPKREFLKRKSLVLVMGSGRFLGEHLRFYLEDEGIARPHVINALISFLGLPIWRPEMRKGGYVILKPGEIPGYQFYEDYFNAFLDEIAPPGHGRRRLPKGAMTTAELVSKLK